MSNEQQAVDEHESTTEDVGQERYRLYRELVDERLRQIAATAEPRSLYDPTRYVLEAGGKRVRGILVMLAAEAVGGRGIDALSAATSVEILHNFTLVHDDIMDSATTRRGRPTVHTQWDEGVAILVGDVMIGLANRSLLDNPPERAVDVLRALSQAIIDVCEGQTLDRDFEQRRDITLDQYLHMIEMKTGRLLTAAAEAGGLIGGGNDTEIEALRSYARHIGTAFQILDDLLDLVAEDAQFGKRIGGDIIEGKRTYLLIRAQELVRDETDSAIIEAFYAKQGSPEERIDKMRDLFERLGVIEMARRDVATYISQALGALSALQDTDARAMLVWFARMIMSRSS